MCQPSSILAQGAEATISRQDFIGIDVIVKERLSKRYRHSVIDKRLTHQRIVNEARALARLQLLPINVPVVYKVDGNKIFMEQVQGDTVKNFIQKHPRYCDEDAEEQLENFNLKRLAHLIGETLAIMHDSDNIHGDLTTSNMLIQQDTNDLYLIDFGLSFVSQMEEDKAVDLYVLERAFSSTHAEFGQMFEDILASYAGRSKNSRSVIKRLEEVRLRGRKRDMVG
ncbi:hypothetical protein MP228_002757 [Amoeboaphelidium protococcarum]|nr:hypothetical protein MP228_002757 [Amoeboaphelidium protococcarum]